MPRGFVGLCQHLFPVPRQERTISFAIGFSTGVETTVSFRRGSLDPNHTWGTKTNPCQLTRWHYTRSRIYQFIRDPEY